MSFPGCPKTVLELAQWFPDDEASRRYLEQLRWLDGFVCPSCSGKEGWRRAKGVIRCQTCRREPSVTAGTIFADTRTPLPTWFHAAWRMVDSQSGISAQTLRGPVEVDDIYVGGNEPGVIGRETRTKSVVGVAVEAREYEKETLSGLKVVRVAGQGSAENHAGRQQRELSGLRELGGRTGVNRVHGFLRVPGIQPLEGFEHRRFNLKRSGLPAHRSLPHVPRVASLLKRRLNGTHQGAATREHLNFYLDEFTLALQPPPLACRARCRRLLERAVRTEQVTYEQLKGGPSQWQPEGGRLPQFPNGSAESDPQHFGVGGVK